MLRRITSTRARRRALLGPLALVALLVATLTGCDTYTNEQTTCLSQPPASPADYQQAFAARGVWAGADGATTVPLPDGRTIWLFGDTFTDGLRADGSPAGQFIHNSLILQQGGCFSMLSNGGPGKRLDALPPATPGEWLWPTNGVVDPQGFVHIVSLRVALSSGPVGWNWKVTGADISTLRYPELAFLRTVHAPVPQDAGITWGGSSLVLGRDVYLYGSKGGSPVVAKTTVDGIATAPWQLSTGTGWTTNASQAATIQMNVTTSANLTVIPYQGGYLASAKTADMLSSDVTTWYGTSPTGPFTRVGRVATTTNADPNWFAYGGRVVQLPGAGLTVVWSQNAFSATTDMRPYGPVFATPVANALP